MSYEKQIKELLKIKLSTEVVKVKFTDVPLKDGKKLAIDDNASIEVGTAIYDIDENGNLVPCEDNTYVLDDGRSVTVKDGKIESIADTATPEDDAQATPSEDAEMADKPADKPADTPTEEPASDKAAESDVADRVKKLEDAIATIMDMLSKLTGKTDTAMSAIAKLSAEPAVESVQLARQPKENKDSNKSIVENILSLQKKHKFQH